MLIEHVAIWSKNIEALRSFYERYFGATSNAKYVNSGVRFESYFLTFPSGARLELMQMPGVAEKPHGAETQFLGYAHIAFSTGSKEAVDTLTARLCNDGFEILEGPRTTGDEYYESCILDPAGNRIEITV